MSAYLKGPTQQVGLQSFQVDDLVLIGVGCVNSIALQIARFRGAGV